MGKAFQALTPEHIVEINRRLIREFGGIFYEAGDNLLFPDSLDHVLAEIQGVLFGQELYPTAVRKTAVLCQRIVQGHIFRDGNKRTGMEVCRLTLDINGITMMMDDEVITMAVMIAEGKVRYEELVSWLEKRVQERIASSGGTANVTQTIMGMNLSADSPWQAHGGPTTNAREPCRVLFSLSGFMIA